MRPSILPGLLDAVRLNFNHQRRDLMIFELGKVFAAASGEDGLPNEREVLAIVATGSEMLQNRAMPSREVDFYTIKGAVEAVLDAAGVAGAHFSAIDTKHLRAGQSAAVYVAGETVGYVGRLSDEIAGTYKFRQAVYVTEINLQTVLQFPVAPINYRTLDKYPAIVRDVSFVVNRAITFSAINQAIGDQGFELCKNVTYVDVYEGEGMAESERSITVRMEYRSSERTLLEDEVESLHAQIVSEVKKKLGVKTR